jgi:CHAD domain-containing protein
MIRLVEHFELTDTAEADLLAHLRSSLKAQWKRYRRQFAKCQSKCSEKAVHQLRVETRRLLALLDLLEPLVSSAHLVETRKRLKKLFRKFSDLRDTHVQAATVHDDGKHFPAVEGVCAWLDQREGRLIKRAGRDLRAARLDRLKRSIAVLRGDLRACAKDPARAGKAFGKVMAGVNGAFQTASTRKASIDPARTETIHRARVAFKKFRYMAEALQPVLPGANDSLIQAMQAYQTLMGEVQDAEVLLGKVDKFLKNQPEMTDSLQSYREALEQRRAGRIARFLRAKERLAGFWPLDRPPVRVRPVGQRREAPR